MKNLLKLLFERTAHTTKGEQAVIAKIVGKLKIVVIKMKIISIIIIMMLSMMSNRIGFFLFDFFVVFLLNLMIEPSGFYGWIFFVACSFFLAVSGAWSYRWLISSNTYEAYRLVLKLSSQLLKEDELSKAKSKLEKIELSLQQHLKQV